MWKGGWWEDGWGGVESRSGGWLRGGGGRVGGRRGSPPVGEAVGGRHDPAGVDQAPRAEAVPDVDGGQPGVRAGQRGRAPDDAGPQEVPLLVPPAAGRARSGGSPRQPQQGQVGWVLGSGEGFWGHRSLVTRAPGCTHLPPSGPWAFTPSLPILAAPLDEGAGLAPLRLRARDSRSEPVSSSVGGDPNPRLWGDQSGLHTWQVLGTPEARPWGSCPPQRLPAGCLLAHRPAWFGCESCPGTWGPACLLTPGTSPAREPVSISQVGSGLGEKRPGVGVGVGVGWGGAAHPAPPSGRRAPQAARRQYSQESACSFTT